MRCAKEGQLNIVAQDMNFDGIEELYAAVGYAHVTPRKVLNKLYAVLHPGDPAAAQKAAEPAPAPAHEENKGKLPAGGVAVSGVDGVLMRFARCCNPVPGDPIVGYISRGAGITVHRADCPNVPNMEPERLISVHWEGEEGQQGKPFEGGIFVLAKNQRGALASIATVLAGAEVNIQSATIKALVDGRSTMHFVVEVKNADQLYEVIERIGKLPAVVEAVRDSEDADATVEAPKA